VGSIFILSPQPTDSICLVCRETQDLKGKGQKRKETSYAELSGIRELCWLSGSQAVLSALFLMSLN
jgi:hypothetical protein